MDDGREIGGESGSGGASKVPVILTALIVLAISGGVVWLVNAEHHKTVHADLVQQAGSSVGRLREAFSVNQERLYSIGSFFESSVEVSRLEFGKFVRRSFNQESVLLALGYVPLIRAEEREDFVAQARADGLAKYELRELDGEGHYVKAASREAYAPIYYAEPMEEYHDVLGVDLWTDPLRRQALTRARDEGRPVATMPVDSLGKEKQGTRLIVYLPIYHNDAPTTTEQQRREAIKGFASAVFGLDRLLAEATDLLESGIVVEVFDLEKDSVHLITTGGDGHMLATADRGRTVSEAFELAGRQWQISFTPTRGYDASHSNMGTWLSVCGCLVFTSILCGWAYSTTLRQTRVSRIMNDSTSELIITNSALKQENKQRRWAERMAARKSVELEVMNTELESFSYSISHDLRAPLRAITGFTGFVLRKYEEELPEDALRNLNQVLKGGEQMNELIEGLLEFSSVQRAELKKQTCNMSEIARSLMQDLLTTFPDRQVEVIWGKLPAALGDRTLIRQVWQNLLSNALKYTGKRSDAVIEIGAKLSGEGETVFYMKDNGAGFDMSQSDRLFGVFQRFHSQSQFEGTGIGLANVSKIVQRHGGRVWAKAEVDKGATFYFTLDVEDPESSSMGDSTLIQTSKRQSKR